MLDVGTISSAADLPAHAEQAASSAENMRALLARVAEIAEREQGWPKLLSVVVRLAWAEWMDGDLHVELSGDDKGTTMVVYSEHGVGIRERVFPPHYFAVPIDEFQRAVLLTPKLVSPLVAAQGLNRLTLAPNPDELATGDKLELELDERSLGDNDRKTAPPPPDAPALDAHTRPTAPPPPDVNDGG